MKKWIALFLIVVMTMSLLACSKQDPEVQEQTATVEHVWDGTTPPVEGFQVGFARKNITPTAAVPISGITANSTDRMSTSVHDTLYVSALAVTGSNGETVLFMTWDLQGTYATVLNFIRDAVSQQTGVARDNVLMTATHTHSGPAVTSKDVAYMEEFRAMLGAQCIAAAKEALLDRKPAELYYSQVETERMNFVRHYSYVDKDGNLQYFGDQYRINNTVYDETTKHASEADPTMYVMRVAREGDNDIVFVNWRAHPHIYTSSTSYRVSADFIGSFRTALEMQYDCEFMYFQGAAGNVNNKSKIAGEAQTFEYGEYGRIMANYALEAMKNETKLEDTTLLAHTEIKQYAANHTEEELYSIALECRNMWKNGYSNSEATAFGEPYGVYGPIHAGEIISRPSRGEFITDELHIISLGKQLAIVTAPHELFDTNSVWLEGQSPYDVTLTFCYTNGMNGYVPSAQAVEYGCYELNCTKLMPGHGEIIQNDFLAVLNDLYEK